jgi:hypothetical protein
MRINHAKLLNGAQIPPPHPDVFAPIEYNGLDPLFYQFKRGKITGWARANNDHFFPTVYRPESSQDGRFGRKHFTRAKYFHPHPEQGLPSAGIQGRF